MAERLQFDLVVIGGGFAGLCAALRGAELGLRTAIVETGAEELLAIAVVDHNLLWFHSGGIQPGDDFADYVRR